MSLFKIFRGTKEQLDDVQEKHDGYAYYLTDKSNLLIDYGTERKKIIGLSQINKSFFDISFEPDMTKKLLDEPNDPKKNFFKAEGYTYIVSPQADADSYDAYIEAGVRASAVTEGSMTLKCKELPKTAINISILRIEEDPYEQV